MIQNAVSGDEGVYQCFAGNHFESIQSQAQLIVSSKLLIRASIYGNLKFYRMREYFSVPQILKPVTL